MLLVVSNVICQENIRASQNPIHLIWCTSLADFCPSLSVFKKVADIEFSYEIMYVCTVGENFFVMSWCLMKFCA